jgi:putative endonuclease
MAFWVYILKCADDSFYTGHTDNLEKRIAQHHAGELHGYTHTRRPLTVAFTQDFPTRIEALAMEQQIKGWTRAKKQALIDGNWQQLSQLAKSHQTKMHTT